MKWFRKPGHWIKRHKILSGIIFIIALVLFSIFRPKPVAPLETEKITTKDLIQSVSVSGSIASETSVNLNFPISGKLVYVGAKKGDAVKKYQTIASLDQRTIEDNIQNAVKNYQSQKISFDTVNDFNGDRNLSDTGLSVSARRQLQTALNTLDQTQIALEIQQIAKEQSLLFSPIDGIITRADVQVPGVNITTATTYTVADPTHLVFQMDVDEADIGKIKAGQPVKVNLDAYPDTTPTYKVSKIDFVSHTTTNGGNAFTVEVLVPSDASEKYRIGMNGNAEIITAEKDQVLTVPIASVVDEKYVYIKTANGFEKRNVTLGLENDIDAEVIDGLQEGDTVATDPSKVPTPKKSGIPFFGGK